MNHKKILDNIQVNYIINTFFLIGFIVAGIKLENYLYEIEDYSNYQVPANTELILKEQSNEVFILPDYDNKSEYIFFNVKKSRIHFSYRFTILAYNSFIKSKFKTIVPNYISHSNIISIVQMNNIWHKSSDEEPGISD